MQTDLWPEFTAPEQVKSPVFLLKEQAAALDKKTKGVVQGEISSGSTNDGGFWVSFELTSPALGTYMYRLLYLEYPTEFYPMNILAQGQRMEAADEESFRNVLRTVLSSPKTKQVVEAIMAQAHALTGRNG